MMEFVHAHPAVFWSISVASLVLFLGTLCLLPVLAVRIPEDYFLRDRRHPLPWGEHQPLLRWTLIVVKNLIGLILLVAGLCMVFLPGQGLLTMVVGTLLLNFPGKYRLERWLIRRRAIRNGVNWLRERRGHCPLQIRDA